MKRILIVSLLFTLLLSGCGSVSEFLKKTDYALKGKNYDEIMEKKNKARLENLEKIKGYNFHSYDVRGFRLNDDVSDVERYFNNHGEWKLRVDHQRDWDSHKAYTTYLNKEIFVFGTYKDHGISKLYSIFKAEFFSGDVTPLYHNVTSSFTEKYGPPSVELWDHSKSQRDRYTTELYWEFDIEGNLLPSLDLYEEDEVIEKHIVKNGLHKSPLKEVENMERLPVHSCEKPNCKYFLSATIRHRIDRSKNLHEVTGYSIYLVDMVRYEKEAESYRINQELENERIIEQQKQLKIDI